MRAPRLLSVDVSLMPNHRCVATGCGTKLGRRALGCCARCISVIGVKLFRKGRIVKLQNGNIALSQVLHGDE
jgi:hypothetical protein